MKKFLFGIGLFVFLAGTSFLFSGEYRDFVNSKQEIIQANEEKQSALSLFSFAQISSLDDGQLYFTPDKKYLDTLVSELAQAKKRIYLNVYIFTEKRIRSELIKAKKRGVDVKVILEKNVYNASNINKQTYDMFVSGAIDVQWSSNDMYSLDHAKYIVLDETLILSTGNFSYTTFSSNRDIFLHTKNQDLVKTMTDIFLRDFEKKYVPVYHPLLVVSPWDSREKISYLLKNATSSIDIFMPYMNDSELGNIILEQAKKGIRIRVVTGNDDIEDVFFEKLKDAGGNVTFLKKTIHAKSFLIDKKYLYLGSENFSTPSLDKNKEVGIVFLSQALALRWLKVFESDL